MLITAAVFGKTADFHKGVFVDANTACDRIKTEALQKLVNVGLSVADAKGYLTPPFRYRPEKQ